MENYSVETIKYEKEMFASSSNILKAHEIEVGDIIHLDIDKSFGYENRSSAYGLFLVDCIELEFINDEVAKKYEDIYKAAPEDVTYIFIDEFSNKILDIPSNAEFIVSKSLRGLPKGIRF